MTKAMLSMLGTRDGNIYGEHLVMLECTYEAVSL